MTLADVNEEHGRRALEGIEKEFGQNKALFVNTDVTDKKKFEGKNNRSIIISNKVRFL